MNSNIFISILCPCFNHEKYVSYFISSVLLQNYTNFELIIVDDCSTDNTVKIIQNFKDTRIKLIKHNYNKGVNEALNTGFSFCSGDFIIICASDDCFEQNALDEYVYNFEKEPDKVFYINLRVIDENNNPRTDYPNCSMPFIKQMERTELLHNMFYIGNAVYSPGMALSRDNLKTIFPLPPANSIYQDYKMHIELLSNFNVKILKNKLIKYRIPYNGTSLSGYSEQTQMRTRLEEDSLMDSFCLINDLSLIKDVFSKEIDETGLIPYSESLSFFLGMMALHDNMKNYQRKIWGIHTIMNFYNSDENKIILFDKYKFSYSNLISLYSKLL